MFGLIQHESRCTCNVNAGIDVLLPCKVMLSFSNMTTSAVLLPVQMSFVALMYYSLAENFVPILRYSFLHALYRDRVPNNVI